jgi:hypothetical protein
LDLEDKQVEEISAKEFTRQFTKIVPGLTPEEGRRDFFGEFDKEILAFFAECERRHDHLLAAAWPPEQERRASRAPTIYARLEDLDLFEAEKPQATQNVA